MASESLYILPETRDVVLKSREAFVTVFCVCPVRVGVYFAECKKTHW